MQEILFKFFLLILFFLSNPVSFNGQNYQEQRGLELVTSRSSGYERKLKNIPLFVIYYLTEFDDVT